jgi:hypothetical protein
MRWLVVLSGIVLFTAPASRLGADDYVVVSFVSEGDPFYAAAQELQRLRGGPIIATTEDKLDSLLADLRRLRPRFVAVVLRPETIDENLARKFLILATKIDDDPFVDFAYGFITGGSVDVAVALAGAGKRAEERPRQPDLAMMGVAGGQLKESNSSTQILPLRKGSLKFAAHTIAAGESANATSDELDPEQDDHFIREAIPKLAGHSIVLFAGHGYPRQVVGGPTYQHLVGQRFDSAVVMNIACYTGVTGRWFDSDWRSMTMREKTVPAEESFCLNMLKTGVAGYVAYVSARPAGPAMLGDAITLATEGESVGELLRNNANSVVLAHLQQGYDALHVDELTDKTPISRERKVRDVLIAMSTGGVLFGDPAYVPFKRQAGAHPARLNVAKKSDALVARVETAGPLYHFFCGDQIVMWDESQPSLRIEARVPLGDRYATDATLTSSTLGDVPHRLTAATEEHRGKRFLHVKASFAQPAMVQMMALAQKDVTGSFEIKTASEPRELLIVRRGETK